MNIEIGAQSEIDRKGPGEERRFGELYSEKHPHEGKAQRQVYVEARHEEVRDCEVHGQGNFEWNTDFIVTKKLENYSCQAAQDLYNGEAEHEPRGAHEEQHCRSLHETSEWIERSRTQGNLNLESGWYEW